MALLFSLAAKHHFDPMARQFGLVCTASCERVVQYENDQVCLRINFDNGRSYELSVEFGKMDTQCSAPFFSLAEILRLQGIQDATFVNAPMVRDEEGLQVVLARLAELTVRHAADFLKGNSLSFDQVAELRNKESTEFELDAQLRHARSAVDAAWSTRDYMTIINVLTPLEAYLSPVEKKRLDYSKSKV
jgi:hypothetical protein